MLNIYWWTRFIFYIFTHTPFCTRLYWQLNNYWWTRCMFYVFICTFLYQTMLIYTKVLLLNKVKVLCVFYNVFHWNILTTEELLRNKVYVLRLYIHLLISYNDSKPRYCCWTSIDEQGLYFICSHTHLFGQDYIMNWATID